MKKLLQIILSITLILSLTCTVYAVDDGDPYKHYKKIDNVSVYTNQYVDDGDPY